MTTHAPVHDPTAIQDALDERFWPIFSILRELLGETLPDDRAADLAAELADPMARWRLSLDLLRGPPGALDRATLGRIWGGHTS